MAIWYSLDYLKHGRHCAFWSTTSEKNYAIMEFYTDCYGVQLYGSGIVVHDCQQEQTPENA